MPSTNLQTYWQVCEALAGKKQRRISQCIAVLKIIIVKSNNFYNNIMLYYLAYIMSYITTVFYRPIDNNSVSMSQYSYIKHQIKTTV
jgi:hypothetical protein